MTLGQLKLDLALKAAPSNLFHILKGFLFGYSTQTARNLGSKGVLSNVSKLVKVLVKSILFESQCS